MLKKFKILTKKYLAITKIETSRQMVHRVNVLMYRIGAILELIAPVIIWSILYQNIEMIKGYTYPEMMTYVIIGWLIAFLVSNFGLDIQITEHIREGFLSNFIIKPLSYLRYITALTFGRISLALGSSILIFLVFIIIFRNIIIFDLEFSRFIILLFMIFNSFFITLFISIILGMTTFWIIENKGLKYSLIVLTQFFSGALFPIVLGPPLYQKIAYALPFAYTFFVPMQLYLKKISIKEGLYAVLIQIFWLIFLYFLVKLIWKRGMKKYESVGI